MSNFKKGDLVEVVGSLSYPELVGNRFTLTITTDKVYAPKTKGIVKGLFWDSPFKDKVGRIICFKENQIKKVNPDGDNLSEFTFDELMNDLKYTKQKEKSNEHE